MMPHFELSTWLQTNYDLPPLPEISLLRSYTNDVYRVTSSEGKYVLKIYGASWRSEDEIKYEVELLNHLDKEGLSVAKPIRGTKNEIVKRITTGLGDQFAVLYEYAAGEKPEVPFSNQLYFLFGEAIGRMHELSKTFTSGCVRKKIDLEYLIDQPLQVILPLFERRSQETTYLRILGDKIKSQINELSKRGLDWGPIHGDATLDNLHVVENKKVILYDFDSGGPGWRASDLQGWAIGYPEYQERYDSFLNGYRQVRAVNDQDIEASWYITLAWDIWGIKIDLENRVLKRGQAAANTYLTEQIEWIREREKFLR